MQMQPVQSSQITSVGYDSETETLHVTFSNNSTYEYEGVPEDEYQSLISASSVGQYFNANIKNSFNYKRI